MSKGVSTVWYEPMSLCPAREGLLAYFYSRYERKEEIETKPVETLAILELIETFTSDPAKDPDELVGFLEREARMLVLNEQMGGLAPAESLYYGTVSKTFLGYGPVGIDFALMENEPYYFAEELEIARETPNLAHLDQRIFPTYGGHRTPELFKAARQKRQPDVYFDYRNGF